jgi:methenyltetrahydrofolate cyclohydrolase
MRFGELTLATFVDRLASAEPVPGGGSAAAVAGSLGAGLVAMVGALSENRPKYAEHASLYAEIVPAARTLADRFLQLANEDAAAYATYAAAMKLPRDTEEQQAARKQAIREAARVASIVPFRCVEACDTLVNYAEALAGRSNRNAASDLEVASLLAVAAVKAAAANVHVNLPAIEDEAAAGDLLRRSEALVDQVEDQASRIRHIVRSGEPRAPLRPGGRA